MSLIVGRTHIAARLTAKPDEVGQKEWIMRQSKIRRVLLDLPGLIGDIELFRLSGAVQRSAEIDTWFLDGPAELRLIAQQWFNRMRQCGSDVRELMHDGCPVACVEDVPFGYVNSFKNHVNVGFFYGAALPDSASLLEGNGKRMRHVKLRPDRILDSALSDLVDAAYRDIKTRLAG